MQCGPADVFAYPALIERLDGEVIVRIRDVPEALTGAETEREALALAEDALEEAVLARLADGRDIPLAGPNDGCECVVLLPPLTAARVLVDHHRRARRWSKVDLANAMKRDEKVVRRILDGRNGVSLETVLEALTALGYRSTLAWN